MLAKAFLYTLSSDLIKRKVVISSTNTIIVNIAKKNIYSHKLVSAKQDAASNSKNLGLSRIAQTVYRIKTFQGATKDPKVSSHREKT